MNLILISATIASISITITKSSLFKPIRPNWKLFHCPYCLSHYLAFVFSLFTKGNWFINTFALVTFATIFSLLILLSLNEMDKQ